jgi:hypothetical protein
VKLAMLLIVAGLSGTVAASATAASPAAPARAASSAPPCLPKITAVGGKTEVAYCGPATATLKIGSKTYNFKNGYCGKDPTNKIALQLTLGTIVQSKSPVNGGQPLFEMTLLSSSVVMIETVNADYGGQKIVSTGFVSAKGSIPSEGTFTAKGLSVPAHFSGSWNCHGVVYSHG